jgi:ATP-binding cassette subfamily F protein 3
MAKTLISIAGLHKQYGANVILDDAEVTIRSDQKIGVIGRNGAGKSTLCRIILGEEEADSGRVTRHADLQLSYLEQKDPFLPGETVLAFLMRYSQRSDWECGKLAGRFLLKNDLLERAVASLSGGFQTRVKLTAMLLREPNFLILDEPTNYLDLRTLILLEDFLARYEGGFMIVSHDREFLVKTCTETMEVEGGRITLYPGDVSAYLDYKAQQREQAEAVNANLEIRRKQLQTFVDRNKAKASKATQAASKVKMLERLRPIEIRQDQATVTITMPPIERRTGSVLRVDGLDIGYPGKVVARGITIDIDRGQHVAVLGDNGQGKTTFLNTVAGVLPPLAGTLRWGHDVRIGYYAQHVFTSMDPTMTVLRYLERAAASSGGGVPIQPILNMAGAFLFRGDDVQKRIAVLSGGERSRLCLAGLLLSRVPVLLLDEPTNHLDFDTVEALASALRDYQGTIFFTSHDRTFVATLATAILDVRDGRAQSYPDSYASYVYRIERESRGEPAPGAAAAARPAVPTGGDGGRERRRERDGRAAALRTRLRQTEAQVARLDAEKKALEARMIADPAAIDGTLASALRSVTERLDQEEASWLAISADLEALTSTDRVPEASP